MMTNAVSLRSHDHYFAVSLCFSKISKQARSIIRSRGFARDTRSLKTHNVGDTLRWSKQQTEAVKS